jgi:SNF2 family DNA or RNA helicase
MIIKLALDSQAQPHQKSAVKKFDKTNGIIFSHGLGSGKTFSSIMAGETQPGRKLVLAPASLLSNYGKELKKFNVDAKNYDLMSLETFRKNPEYYVKKFKPSTMIVDEFHRSRTEDTTTNEALNKVRPKVKKFIGLTGSILNNEPSEIVPLVNLAAGGPVFKDVKSFNKDFLQQEMVKPSILGRVFFGAKPGEVTRPKNLDAFKQMVSPYIHSFSGDPEYKKNIPTVNKEVVHITMSKEQQNDYDFANKKLPVWMRYKIKHNIPPSKQEAAQLNAFMSTSRQVSNSLAPYGNPTPTPKMNRMLADLQDGIKKDKNFKSITFSNYLDAGLIPYSQQLNKAGIRHGIFTGKETQEARTQMIKDYNQGKLRHLLISPAGIEGLDLKSTKLVQKMEPDWNPERNNQAIGRAARFKSHESLPEKERNVLVREYMSDPRLDTWDKIKHFFNHNSANIGVDSYIKARSLEKENLNKAFLDKLQEIQ